LNYDQPQRYTVGDIALIGCVEFLRRSGIDGDKVVRCAVPDIDGNVGYQVFDIDEFIITGLSI
jgi:hypothetical protein